MMKTYFCVEERGYENYTAKISRMIEAEEEPEGFFGYGDDGRIVNETWFESREEAEKYIAYAYEEYRKENEP